MNILESSTKERVEALIIRATTIAYESNNKREGWELHKLNSEVEITNSADIKTDEYYLHNIYLSADSEEYNNLWNIVEGFPQFLATYLSGRTSIHNMLTVYTPENLEEILNKHENQIIDIDALRNKFIARQNVN
jgi:hypothetical protein